MDAEQLLASLLISDSNTLGVLEIMTSLLISFILMFPIAMIYKYIQGSNGITANFIMTLFMFGVLSSVMMLLIGNNVARAFGMVGALSIIRFRTALKDPLDAVFIFWCLCIGMACGSGFFLLASVAVGICGIVAILIKLSGIAKPSYFNSVLKVIVDEKARAENPVESSLRKSFKKVEKVHEYTDVNQNRKTFVYTLQRGRKNRNSSFEQDLLKVDGVEEVHHLNKSDQLFLENRH